MTILKSTNHTNNFLPANHTGRSMIQGYKGPLFPVFRPHLPPAPNKATEIVMFFYGDMFAPKATAAGGSSRQAGQAHGPKTMKSFNY